MIKIILLSSLFLFVGAASADKKPLDLPEKTRGEITDIYCGELDAFKEGSTGVEQSDNGKKTISGRCIFFVSADNNKKYGIISSGNSWITHLVPEGESHGVLVGRIANFSSCGPVDDKHAVQINKSDMSKKATYMDCYEHYTYLETPVDVRLTPENIAGVYSNKRGDLADLMMDVYKRGDLFTPATYSIEVEYEKKSEDAVYILVKTEGLLYVNNKKRPYFVGSYEGDCDSPDCYNTDGEIYFYKNKNGTFTMRLSFNHYNNSPIEMGDEYDFSDDVYLKRTKKAQP